MRNLQTELFQWLDVSASTLAAYQEKNAAALLWQTAIFCVGIQEEGGNNQGHFIKLFQETVGPAQGEPWCMAFAQSMIAFAELHCDVQSLIVSGESCLDVLHRSVDAQVMDPQPGDLIIWQHGDTANGHVGIITALQDGGFTTIEGNTSDESGLNRDGDGVYAKKRPNGPIGMMRIAGFLRPFGA